MRQDMAMRHFFFQSFRLGSSFQINRHCKSYVLALEDVRSSQGRLGWVWMEGPGWGGGGRECYP